MERGGGGRVDASPAQQLGPPGDIRIFAVEKEIGIEESSFDGDVADHAAAVQGGRAAGPEDVLRPVEAVAVGFVPAAVEMPHFGGDVQAGGIEDPPLERAETRSDRKELPAHGARRGVHLACFHQSPYEAWAHQNVGVEREDPVGGGGADNLVLRRGEAFVPAVPDHADTAPVALQDFPRSIRGGVIGYHHLQGLVLAENRIEAALDVAAAVVRDYGHQDPGIRHFAIPSILRPGQARFHYT